VENIEAQIKVTRSQGMLFLVSEQVLTGIMLFKPMPWAAVDKFV
jgi:hypothetical protein